MVEQMAETPTALSQSEERLLDAEEIEKVASTLKRPTARMQLESLAKKLRKEAAALKVVEGQGMATTTPESTSSATTTSVSSSTPVVTPTIIPAEPPKPLPIPAASLSSGASSIMYSTIDRFSFDAGGYNEKFVTLYVPLPGVGDIPKDQVTCKFDKAAFDLIVNNLNGQSYRLKKDDLEHDIVPDKSKIIIKADKVIVKLAKVKGEYGSFDYWSKLTDPKRKEKDKKKADPSSSITDLMKEMYESGDDNIRKIIGETMMKQQRGELGNGPSGMGLGGDLDDI